MLSENYYIQAQLNLLNIGLTLAAGDTPKRSGDFESTYKTATGTEITVRRSPDGKFANEGGGANPSSQQTPIVSIEKAFAKSFSDFGDKMAKLPAKVQDAVRKAVFDSEFSRAINKEAEKLVKKINDPSLMEGFNLGQRIKDELAKKPFSEFGETVAKKFAEFRKELPQKSEDLKKEIIRIAKDPNTSTTVAAGALLGLAGNFYIAGLFSGLRAGGVIYGILKLPNVATVAAELTTQIPELAAMEGAAIKMAKAGLALTKTLSAGIVGAELLMGTAFTSIGHTLTSVANSALMNRVKSNEVIEKERLKKEILAKKEDSDTLYQQQLEQQAKDAKTQQRLIEELQKDTPKTPEEMTAPDGTLAAPTPVFTVNLSDEDEAYVADPKNYEAVMTEAYKDEEFIKLAFAYTETQALEVLAIFTGSETEANKFHEIGEQATQAIKDRLTVVIKEEIKRQRVIQR